MDDRVIAAAQQLAVQNELACADAHEIAHRLNLAPSEVGRFISSSSDLRFNRCQLGLFGYGPKAEGKSKIVLSAANIPPEIEQALREQVVEGRLACLAVWQIADAYKYPRLGMANVVQALGLKVSPCQLGCF